MNKTSSDSSQSRVHVDVSKLPSAYRWLGNVDGLPKTIQECIKLHGVTEVVGRGSNKTIISWRDELNQAGATIIGFSDDDIPWCGLFAAIIAYRRVGKASEVVDSPLWARNWVKYGEEASKACLGDCLVFSRGSGGHVGFYVGEDKYYYHVFGGNQSNKVSITRVAKSRTLAIRRPHYNHKPQGVKSFYLAASGTVSHNEA